MTTENIEKNKEIVRRFNKEVIEQGNLYTFRLLMDNDFINHSAPITANGADGMWNTFSNVLRPAFPDLFVEIYEQIAEGDKVVTRKVIKATHTGKLFDISSTGQKIKIDVIDIVRIKDGKYIEHWGINTLQTVLSELKNL